MALKAGFFGAALPPRVFDKKTSAAAAVAGRHSVAAAASSRRVARMARDGGNGGRAADREPWTSRAGRYGRG